MQKCDIDNIRQIEQLLRSDKIKELGLKNGVMFHVYTKMYENEAFTYIATEPLDDSPSNAYRMALRLRSMMGKKLGFPLSMPTNDPDGIKTIAISYNRKNLDTLQGIQQVKKSDDPVSVPPYANNADVDLENKYFNTGPLQTTSSVLREIARSPHPLAPIAEQLQDYVTEDFEIELVDYVKSKEVFNNAKKYGGLYDPVNRKIQIDRNAQFRKKKAEPLILHEILHGLTYDELRRDTEANTEFNKLYEYTKDKFKDSEYYALKNTDEFIVALFTDALFIAQLNNVPAMPSDKNFNNLFEQVFDYILNLFGFQKGNTAYTQAFAVATHILRNQRVNAENVQANHDAVLNALAEDVYQEYYELMEKDEIEKDCTRAFAFAKNGLSTGFSTGGQWKIVKDLKGYPTHEKGGVDLFIGKDGVSMSRGSSKIKAEDGLVIAADGPGPKGPGPKTVSPIRGVDQFQQPKALINTAKIPENRKLSKRITTKDLSVEDIEGALNASMPNRAPSIGNFDNPIMPVDAFLPYPTVINNFEPFIRIEDKRKVRATTGKPVDPNKDLMGGDYPTGMIDAIIQTGKQRGYSQDKIHELIAIGLQETNLGRHGDVGHVLDYDGANAIESMMNAYDDKMKKADALKITDEAHRIQLYNGTGIVTPQTEKGYHGFEMQKIYGVPIPKGGIDMSKTPLYGKQIIDLRDNVIRQNPELLKYINDAYNK